MIQPKRMITAGGTLLCALGIGYFMQSSSQPPAAGKPQQAGQQVAAAGMVAAVKTDAAPEPVAEPAPEPVADAAGAEPSPPKSDIALDEVTLTAAEPALPKAPEPARLPEQPIVNAALEDQPVSDLTKDMPEEETAPGFSCDYTLSATPQAAAMVRLELSAPCMPNEKFTLHHNGMMFTEVTDAEGMRDFVVPALAETSVFIVAFANGEGAVANTQVTSLDYYDRAVLQWQGQSGMQIHALEYGADYDSDGHVWAAAARDDATAALGDGGFITRHGAADVDNALMAEVYTFPTGVAKREGDVVLSVEAEVTQANCGRDIEAQSLQKQTDGSLKSQDLVLAMPDCNAVGDYLVLKNLLNDLKIASN